MKNKPKYYLHFFSILLLFCKYPTVFSQQSKIDSLLSVLKTAKEDSNKVNILNDIAYSLWSNNPDSTIILATQSAEIARKINFKMGEAKASNINGIAFEIKGEYDNALNFYFKALEISKTISDKRGMANSYNNIGNIYNSKSEYDKALEHYYKALKLFEEIGDKQRMAASYINISNFHIYKGDYTIALELCLKALQLFEEIGDKLKVAVTYGNIGIIYSETNNYDKALEFYFKNLQITKELDDKLGIANSYTNIAEIYVKENDYNKGIEFYNHGLRIYEELGDKQRLAGSYHLIGDLYFKQGKIVDAKQQQFFSLNIAKEIGANRQIVYAYNSIAECDSALGDFKNAYQYYKLSSVIKDSIFNAESELKTAEMNAKYETEKKDNEIKLLNKNKEVAEAESKKQQIIIWSVVGGLLLVMVFASLIFRSLRITKKQKHLIEIQKEKVEQQKEEITKQKEIVEEQKTVVEKQKHLVEEHQKEIIDSITYAKRLQQAILPPVELIKKHLPESFLLYKPKDIVAGDFYWMETMNNSVFIAAADCTGHGVPGAMVSVVCSNALNRAVKEFGLRDTGKILDKVTDLVLETFEKSGEEIKDGMDISLLKIEFASNPDRVLNPVRVEWCGANNPLWYFNGEFKEITANKQPVGKSDNRKPFTSHTIEYTPGSVFYLFTDGYPDQFGGPKGKKYKYKQLEEKLLASNSLPLEKQQTILEKSFIEWKGTLEQVDDITIIGVRI